MNVIIGASFAVGALIGLVLGYLCGNLSKKYNDNGQGRI